MTRPPIGRPTALYRFYDADEALLYVGITYNLQKRWTAHRLDKTWWHLVARKTHQWYETRALAEAAEQVAIETESPRFDATCRRNPGFRTGGRYEDPRKPEIAAQLRADLQAEEFQLGRMLPSSPALAERYGTSPMTVSILLWELERQRVLEGAAGRYWLRGCRPKRDSKAR